MTDLDLLVAEALERTVPFRRDAEPDWADVLRRAHVVVGANGHAGLLAADARRPRPSRWYAVAAAVAALIALVLATPLGGAIRDTVGDFSSWLRGMPGTPVSAEEQRAFDESNARSYAAFPGSPQLRRLIRTEVDGVGYDLLGFRSGDSLCIRLVAKGEAAGSTLHCAPVDELRHGDAPARVLVADWPVGRGDKKRQVGFDTYTSARAHVTAGIAADGVRAVELSDEHGLHEVDVRSNAFLYVAGRPEVGQRVTHVRARMQDGRTVGVPFTVSPWGPGGGFGGASGEPGGPREVERPVRGGGIGWLERREARGAPIPQEVRGRFEILADVEFGRLITPDPQSAKRMVLSVGRRGDRFLHPAQAPDERVVCYTVLTRGSASGSCLSADELFPDGPLTFGYGSTGAGDQFATFAGIASDDVARLELFTATGNTIHVPLRDNAYLADVALNRLPAKLVAYDAEGRVIAIRESRRDEGPATVVGPPVLRLEASAAGTSLELVVHETREGGQCWFGRSRGRERINVGSCVGENWRQAPVRLGLLRDPAVFVYGRVRADVTHVVLRYADGAEQRIEPERDGYVLFVVPPAQRGENARLVEFWGVDEHGEVVGRQRVAGPR